MCATVVTFKKTNTVGGSQISFGRYMHVPVIEINLHNITKYQKQRLYLFNSKCLPKLIMWSILKEKKRERERKKKQIASILIDENLGFHSLIFVLEEGSWPSSMLVSRMTNLQKFPTRLCLSTGQFFRAAVETFTQHNIEYGLSENSSFTFKFNVPVGFWWYWN